MYQKKAVLFLILKVLEEFTDSEHFLTQQEIISIIKRRYSLLPERKTVSANLNLLSELGYDINYVPKKGYRLLSRDFDASEVRYMIDSIYSSKSLTSKQARDLADKLSSLLSKYEKNSYSYLYKSDDISRIGYADLFYNIEIINECMNKGKRVEFDYFSYDSSGKPVERMKGYTFYVSPYYLVNNYGKYYLICHYRDKYGPISIFKLDHMMNVRISDKDLVPLNKLEPPVEDFSIADFINSHVYIFSTKVIDAKLRLNNLASNDAIVDWFGKKAKLYEENGVTYAKVRSDEEGLIYWLLQYGDLVQVEEPKELKDKVVEKLKRILCKYEE